MIVSGDLTRDGLAEHFLPVIDFLDELGNERVLAIPGNRDYLAGGPGPRRPADSDFDYFLVAPDTPAPEGDAPRAVLTTPFTDFFPAVDFFERRADLTIVGLDSEPQIPPESLDAALAWFAGASPKVPRVFVTHRSLLPIPRKKLKEGDLLANAGDVLQRLADARVDLVLCAHLHRVHAWRLGDGRHTLTVVNAPSLLDQSPGKENGLLEITLDRERDPHVVLHALDGASRVVIGGGTPRKPRKKPR